ncbi:MAG: hypothetical protein IT205_07285 [Fimbriimonadaceae bacterium]|nr:hypothetical protein [Fimbriimonadaceae bacterium]
MEAVLDELTLVECTQCDIGSRIESLAKTLVALDELGVPRVVRTVADATTRVVSGGHGLSKWFFDPTVDRDAGRLVARRLSSQPYIDGVGGLFEVIEEDKLVETCIGGAIAVGLGYCFFTEGFPVGLPGAMFNDDRDRSVHVYCLSGDEESRENVVLRLLLSEAHIESERAQIVAKIDAHIANGEAILRTAEEVFPNLLFGATARTQLAELTGAEVHYVHVLRHLRTLQSAAMSWAAGADFDPAMSWSPESNATLEHGRFGRLRDFPWPDGYPAKRWSKHSKIGPNAYRIYFEAFVQKEGPEVCIGYVGPHLPTVKDPN